MLGVAAWFSEQLENNDSKLRFIHTNALFADSKQFSPTYVSINTIKSQMRARSNRSYFVIDIKYRHCGAVRFILIYDPGLDPCKYNTLLFYWYLMFFLLLYNFY